MGSEWRNHLLVDIYRQRSERDPPHAERDRAPGQRLERTTQHLQGGHRVNEQKQKGPGP